MSTGEEHGGETRQNNREATGLRMCAPVRGPNRLGNRRDEGANYIHLGGLQRCSRNVVLRGVRGTVQGDTTVRGLGSAGEGLTEDTGARKTCTYGCDVGREIGNDRLAVCGEWL